MRVGFSLGFLAIALTFAGAGTSIDRRLHLKTGDHLLFLGGGLIEQEQYYGLLETKLSCHFPDADVIYRNMGWAGDTVRGSARTSGFLNPDGFARLIREVQLYKPNVIFLAYGNNESFDGEKGVPGFIAGYKQLLDQLAPLRARIILLSPTDHEDLGRPYPEPTEHNRQLAFYTDSLRKLAEERGLQFIDLFTPLRQQPKNIRRTTNGLIPNQEGFQVIAEIIADELLGERKIDLELDANGTIASQRFSEITDFKKNKNTLSFMMSPSILSTTIKLRVSGLDAGTYRLQADKIQSRSQTNQGELRFEITPTAWQEQREKVRSLIVKKNEKHYHRWRPYNDHSRHWDFIGGDGKLYDAEIADLEGQIAKLRRPLPLKFEITQGEK